MNTKLQLLRCVIMGDSCCFFGHRDAAESISAKLKEEIIRLIEEHDVNDYYIGNQGGFDSLVLSVMKELAVSYPQIRYTIVLAYLPDEKSVISETNTSMSVHNGFMLWTLIFYSISSGLYVVSRFCACLPFVLCGFCCGDILHIYAFSGVGFVVLVLWWR